MFLSPLGERLGEGVTTCASPSPNLSPEGERSLKRERNMSDARPN
jgi:hypothetical protein